MRTIRFLRDTDPRREGGTGFKKGDVATLRESSARHWLTRNAAEIVKAKPAPAVPKAEVATVTVNQEFMISGSPDGDTVVSPPDVQGKDRGGSRKRAVDDTGGGGASPKG